MYLHSAGGAGSALYVQNLVIDVSWDWDRKLSMASGSWHSRTQFTLLDQIVNIDIEKLWYNGPFFTGAKRNIPYNFAISAVDASIGITASLSVWSAVFTRFRVQGTDGDLFRASVALMAPDISGL